MLFNQKLPGYLLGKYQLIGTVTFSVLFALVFLLIYIPFSDTAWFGLGGSATFLPTLFFAFGTIAFLSVSRRLMYKSKSLFEMPFWMYTAWCFLEILFVCIAYSWMTLELAPTESELWWEVFRRAVVYGAIALGGPYILSGMYFAIIDKDNIIRLMTYENVITEETQKPDTTTQKITLFDNSGTLKMSLSPENLYYIESDDNYIKVWYTDNKGEIKQYILRCRLKTVEESFKGSGLVRCNRKYIVNIKKVAMLRKESEGYVLDLGNENIPPLPVTKTYTDKILSYFTDESPLLEPIEE
ncbi:MAG: LytTR family transcriptional regulator [Bacteroidales bacterium]|nr:LytTR family transcriptional regulator [Bacteroidales bacterium]